MLSEEYLGNLKMLKQVLAVGNFSFGRSQSNFDMVNRGSMLEKPNRGDLGHEVTNISNFEWSASDIFSTSFQNHLITELLLLKPPM